MKNVLLTASFMGHPVHIFAFCEHGCSIVGIGVIVGTTKLLEFPLENLEVYE